MRLWHTAAATSAQFDDPNLVSHAGLVPVMRLAQDCGLAELVGERVTVAGPCGANTPHKIGCVVAGMIAGADAIDDLDLLRCGGMGELFDGVRAPSTLGSFLLRHEALLFRMEVRDRPSPRRRSGGVKRE